LRTGGEEWDLLRRDESKLRRVVPVNSKVVHRVAIDRVQLDFFAVEKDALSRDGTGRHDVSVGENETPPGVDDEARGLQRCIDLRIEAARKIDLDCNDAAGNSLERTRPFGTLLPGSGIGRVACGWQQNGCWRRSNASRRRICSRDCDEEQRSDRAMEVVCRRFVRYEYSASSVPIS
jgi:hypothetical protein